MTNESITKTKRKGLASRKIKSNNKNTKCENLINKVLPLSKSDIWDDAKFEWDIYGNPIDIKDPANANRILPTRCICGKHNLRYLYRIRNIHTNEVLFPIGSECIRQFDNEKMEESKRQQEAFKNLFDYWKNITRTGGYKLRFDSEIVTEDVMKYFDKYNILVPGPRDLDVTTYNINSKKDRTRLRKDARCISKRNCEKFSRILKEAKENSINYDDEIINGKKNPYYRTDDGDFVRYILGIKIVEYLKWKSLSKEDRYKKGRSIFVNPRTPYTSQINLIEMQNNLIANTEKYEILEERERLQNKYK